MTPEQILQHADRCVKCGLCLAVCPTYRISGDEGESPRGRIALIEGFVEQRFGNSPRLARHLDQCLGCRACETACPSGVAYGRLIEAGVVLQRAGDNRLRRLLRRLLLGATTNQQPLRVIAALLRLYQGTGLQWLARRLQILKPLRLQYLDQLLPPLSARFHMPAAPTQAGSRRRRVALFTGCVSQVLEARVLDSARAVLQRLEHEVLIPSDQRCCGALHLHTGDADTARHLARHNLAEFTRIGAEVIVGVDSGCMAQLLEYPSIFGDQRPETRRFAANIRDVSQYLTEFDWPSGIHLAPLPARVAVHEPCSLRNVMRQHQASYRLLRKIPQIELFELPDNATCCGAAGSFQLTQPALSTRLSEDKINAIVTTKPDLLVTSNIGCALQLSAGVRRAGLDLEVLHPVQLIARQLRP